MTPDPRLEALLADRSSGASEITARARRLLLDKAQGSDEPQTAILDAGVALIEAHPAMAPLLNLVDRLLEVLDDAGPAALERLGEEARARQQAVVEAGSELLQDHATVGTYSRSGTVLEALLAADPAPEVLLSEARPGQEGLTVARDLAEAGVQVTLTVDAALPSLLARADLLLVGADSLCYPGVVNKIGTGALALAAGAAGCPVAVLAASDKVLPRSFRATPSPVTEGRLDVAVPAGVTTEVPLFEVVAWDRIGTVVTEAGPQPPRQLQQATEERDLHPALADRLGDP